jgi:hypothetical protein
MSEREVWKPVPKSDGTVGVAYYSVSSYGRVRNDFTGRILKQVPDKATGYLKVDIGGRTRAVHTLVADAFLAPDPARPHVNHRNGVKTDNRAENLERCTQAENNLHAYATGLRVPISLRGGRNGRAKLTEADVREIRSAAGAGAKRAALALRFGVSADHVGGIVARRTWKHVGVPAE